MLGWLPDKQSLQLVADAWGLLYRNLWAVVAVFLAKDAAAFMLHRLVHRLTNHIAEVGLGLPISSMGNPWWIMMDAQFMEGHIGYQVLVGIFFLLCLPLNILFNTAAVSTAAVLAINRQAALASPGVATASFTGQGRGKVGLADYPRPPPSCLDPAAEDCDISAWLDSAGVQQQPGTADSSSSGTVGSNSSSSSGRGVGQVRFRGGTAAVSFADAATSSTTTSSSSRSQPPVQQQPSPSRSSSSSSSSSSGGGGGGGGGVVQPAAAPALPWLTVVQECSKPPPLLGLKPSLAAVREAWTNQVSCRIQGLWRVDLLFNVWALPLQAASLAVVPVFWTFPRLLGIQLALPAAVLGGARGSGALDESRSLMEGCKNSYAWPFVWLIAAGRLLELVREVVLLAMPNRWWVDVPEVPLAATAVFFVARVLLLRVQDLLPLAAYLLLVRRRQQQQRGAAGASPLTSVSDS